MITFQRTTFVFMTFSSYASSTFISLNETMENETIPSFSVTDINSPMERSLLLTLFIILTLSVIILLTIFGNILVLTAVVLDPVLRSPTHLLMVNLACADLLLGITVLPFSATQEILQGTWPFGRTLCHIWLAIDVLYSTASIYGLMCISIERYIGVTRPLRYPLIITRRRTIFAIVFAWFVAILISMAPYLGWQNQVLSNDQTCAVNDNLTYVIFSCSFSFYIPLIVILCVYGRIYSKATRQHRFLVDGAKQVRMKDSADRQEHVTLRVHIPQHLSASTLSLNSGIGGTTVTANGKRVSTQMTPNGANNKLTKFKRERRAAKTLGIVVGMFILCWSPFFLLLTIKACTSFDAGLIFTICFWLGYCNSCFNPFIYACSSREFRRAFTLILKCHRISYKSAANAHRFSSTFDPIRLQKSHSWDITAVHSLEKSDSNVSYRTSCDSQRQFIPLNTHRKYVDVPRLVISNPPNQFQKLHQTHSSPTFSRSLNTFTTTASPWHLQQPPRI